jgi:hypothetical protein
MRSICRFCSEPERSTFAVRDYALAVGMDSRYRQE